MIERNLLLVNKLNLFSVLFLVCYSNTVFAEYFIVSEHTHQHNNYVQAQWESHYVTEGRDNLDGAAIQSTILNIEYGLFQLLVWNGWGYDSNYNELNIIPSVNFELDDLNVYFNFNHKQFFVEDESENDIGSGLSYQGLPHGIYTGIDWYHSFNADGSFFEIVLGKNYNPVEKLSLDPSIITGFNNNYIADGHNGLNHICLHLNGEYEINKQFNIHGFVSYNMAINSDSTSNTGDKLLKNFLWGGIGIEALF